MHLLPHNLRVFGVKKHTSFQLKLVNSIPLTKILGLAIYKAFAIEKKNVHTVQTGSFRLKDRKHSRKWGKHYFSLFSCRVFFFFFLRGVAAERGRGGGAPSVIVSLRNVKVLRLVILKAFPDNILFMTQLSKLALQRVKTLWGKNQEMLVTSIFSFFHNVFESTLPKDH